MASQDANAESGEPPNSCTSKSLTFKHHFLYNKKCQATDILRKIIWDMGLHCFLPLKKHRQYNDNNAWLLAESGGVGAAEYTNADIQSLHSSFRLSLSSSATVLMVNLDNGFGENGTHSQELRWRRIESLERNIAPVANTLIRFSYEQVVTATKNFSKGRLLGRGALSCVFRGKVGILRNAVAIKRLDKEDKESPKAFCRELLIASSLHNPKVVPLVGFCMDPEEGLFLVYKYVSGGSLDQHLHNSKKGMKGFPTLSWSVRYKVAIGIAEAISYLHYGTEKCIVHRDIKPSNILLSSKREPKLCDFGLATWTSAPSVPFLCRTVKGTFGYLAPEYFQHGKVSDRTDVYAFGVVLLELITGRKPIEGKGSGGEESLILWAKPLLQKGIRAAEELLDPEIQCTSRTSSQITWMIQAADVCINSEEVDRPDINKILAILRGREEPLFIDIKGSTFPGYGSIVDCYNPWQQTKSAMSSHLALAMLGVSETDDDQYYCYR